MTRIAVIDDWQGAARSSADWGPLEARAELTFFDDALPDEETAAERLAEFDVIMTMRERTPFPASLIKRLPKLRMLSITGSRNLSVDLDALAEQGIVATNTGFGEGGEVAAAELTLGLMLAAARHIPTGDANMRAGEFQNGVPLGFVLRNRTIGLVGLGRLGTIVAGYCQALGMKVLAWSPNLTEERAASAAVEYASKADLLARSDVISVHMVLAPSTVGILGRGDFERMKPGAIVINTSRGPLLDEAALVEFANAGKIVAALDVYEREPLPADHPLRRARNTILTPHVGFCVRENFDAFYRQSVENVLAFLDGAPVRVLTAGA
ncbi:D-2-hydroxyacid dehydrogenase family protein [Faunimonas sp. B44]|uniref:D-2-hydroxyacid dehydrogenase family protein n=1 Tax=Faunimonas sp. B44 TaxID=3461493 RepID=UPI004044C621